MRKEHEAVRAMLRLYAVTDRAWTARQTLEEQIEAALAGGATCVQLREKALDRDAFFSEAIRVREICRRYGVPLIINDDVELAMACGADGVHVGQDDMDAAHVRRMTGDAMIIGVTAKTIEQAQRAQAASADYLGSGAVFGTTTKPGAKPLSIEALAQIAQAVSIPVVAIGGISRENIGRLAGTGVCGAAVVSGLFAAEDIREEARVLRALAEKL